MMYSGIKHMLDEGGVRGAQRGAVSRALWIRMLLFPGWVEDKTWTLLPITQSS